MSAAGIAGLPGPAKVKRLSGVATADDLVHRKFHRLSPNERGYLPRAGAGSPTFPHCVGGAPSEHPTREGEVHCCAVPDTFSREIVGWSIDTAADSRLVVNALDTAIETRNPGAGGIVHADHGARFTSWAFTDEVRAAGLGAPPAKRGNTEIFYNRQRLHSRLDHASPVEHELRYAASVPA